MSVEMDIIIPLEIVHDVRLEPRARLLYGVLFTMAKDFGYCVPTNRELSFHLCASEGRVSHLLGRLESFGYIKREMVYEPDTRELLERKLHLTKQPWTKG